jgi:heme-degrading monooxygenase HmoA
MIVEYIRYKIEPGRSDEFEDAYRRAGKLLDASPHCLRWDAARSVDDTEKQIVRIEWDSAEGHLQGFRRSDDFKPFLEATGSFYDDIEEMTHYEVTTSGGATGDG